MSLFFSFGYDIAVITVNMRNIRKYSQKNDDEEEVEETEPRRSNHGIFDLQRSSKNGIWWHTPETLQYTRPFLYPLLHNILKVRLQQHFKLSDHAAISQTEQQWHDVYCRNFLFFDCERLFKESRDCCRSKKKFVLSSRQRFQQQQQYYYDKEFPYQREN